MLSNKAGYINFDSVTTENQPFSAGTLTCNQFRIPGIIKLSDGRLFAVSDARWDDAKSDFGGIDTMYSVSSDNGKTWHPSFAAYFPDSNGTPVNPSDTTTCIDSCAVQDRNGRVHIMVNMNPTGITTGLAWPCKGNGFAEINGKKYLSVVADYSLTCTEPNNIPKDKLYYVDENKNIVSFVSGNTGYSIDSYFNICKDGNPIFQKQIDSSEEIQQNLFYRDSCFHVYNTMFSLHLWSDDLKNWETEIISHSMKDKDESGLISSPGNGTLTSDGILLFPFYSIGKTWEASSVIVYSEDNGKTFKRTDYLPASDEVKISTECKIVELKTGLWRVFFRNNISKICYADYDKNSEQWTKPVVLPVKVHSDCNFSALKSKEKIYVSYPAGRGEDASGRVNGRLYAFTLDEKFNMTLEEEKLIEENSFSYSCLSENSEDGLCVLFDTCEKGIVIFRNL